MLVSVGIRFFAFLNTGDGDLLPTSESSVGDFVKSFAERSIESSVDDPSVSSDFSFSQLGDV